jgi:hypothetical protein
MNITCYAIVVDSCELSPEDFKEALVKCYASNDSFWSQVKVQEGYYTKQRRIIVYERKYIPDVLQALDILLGKV